MLPRILVALFKALAFPFYLLMLCIEEISGEGHWYRKQRRRMESDRPPLPDADFLRLVPVEPGEEPLWLAVRRAVAEPTGLPAEALYPQDPIADLWRMQWLGPDLMDLVFRLERILTIRISPAGSAVRTSSVQALSRSAQRTLHLCNSSS